MEARVIPHHKFITIRQALVDYKVGFWDGRGYLAVPKFHEVLIDERHAVHAQTAGQIAWQALQATFGELELRWSEQDYWHLDARMPRYYIKPYRGPLWIVDIRSAYGEFYRRLSLYSIWPLSAMVYPLKSVYEIVKPLKPVRSAVIGIIRATHRRWVEGHIISRVPFFNRFLSPILWHQLCMIFSAVADQAMRMGAFFVNTDGYGFTAYPSKFARWLGQKGIDHRVYYDKEGLIGSLSGIKCGPKMSKEIHVSKKPSIHFEAGARTFPWVDRVVELL